MSGNQDITQMTDDEITAEIEKLQATKVPQARPKAQPKRLDAASDKPRKSRGWRDELGV